MGTGRADAGRFPYPGGHFSAALPCEYAEGISRRVAEKTGQYGLGRDSQIPSNRQRIAAVRLVALYTVQPALWTGQAGAMSMVGQLSRLSG